MSELTEALIGDFDPTAVIPSVFKPSIIENEESTNFMDKAICLSLEIRCLGNTRKVASNSVDTPADKDFLHITKNLIAKEYMKELTSLHGEIRSFVSKKCLPASSFFRRGTYLIPIVEVVKVNAKIKEFKFKQDELVEKLISVYEVAQQDAETRLGPLYNPTEYPSKTDVKAAYGIKFKYVAFSTPTKLKEISSAIFQQETEKAKEDIALATDEIKTVLRMGLSELTNHLMDKLSPNLGGPKKIFRDSLITNVREFFDDFNSRNIVNDTELAALVEKAKSCLEGVDAKTLRTDAAVKEKVTKDFTTIKETLDKMLINAPKRKFDFSDDGE
jgi:hypothetical protein